MSLMQLLTTGKSFVGLKEVQPYRVSHERLLPQFGPVKNPFCTTDQLDRPQTETGRRTARPLAVSQPQVAAVTALPAQEPAGAAPPITSKMPVLPVGSKPGSHASAFRSRAAALRTEWAGKLGALFSGPKSKPARVKLPGAPRLQVQGELALDKIKVVRNDLSDADLEVVPARPPTVRANAAPALHMPEATVGNGPARARLAGFFRAPRI